MNEQKENNKLKTTIVIGATGLVGSELINQLILDSDFSTIKLFVRKASLFNHSKIEEYIFDFNDMNTNAELITGDIVFSCLGTTIKTAGSKEAFAKVDFTYVYNFAQQAKRNGVKTFVLVSSLGANANSSNFYLKVKGDIESDLARLKFKNLIIVRPSMLLGNRTEFRLGELVGKVIMKSLSFLFIGKLKKYKAIEAKTVAKAMRILSKNDLQEVTIFENNRLLEIGK